METQTDYETSAMLAVFSSPEQAGAAIEDLRSRPLDIAAMNMVALAPGTYQLDDVSWLEELRGTLRGATWGVPVGVTAGLGLAIVHVLQLGSSLDLLLAFGASGMIAGVLVGALFGAIARTRFDDDVADRLEVVAGGLTELVTIYCAGPAPRIRDLLLQAGAQGILDPTTPEADRAMRPMDGHRP